MEPERHEPPPAPPPPQPEASTATTQGRKNHSFSWSSSSSSSTSSFNSLGDSFKKNDINDESIQQQQQPTSPQLSGEDQLGASSSGRRDYPGYDPSRIPSSIFSKPSNQTDWSVASNESLFSIHTGNSSFSLGEFTLPNYEPTNNIYQSEQPFGLPITSEAEDEVEFGRNSSSKWEEDFQETKEPAVIIAITEPPEIVVTKKEDTPSERMLLESCSNVSEVRSSFSAGSARMSEESGNSCNSFAFPLLTSHEVAATNELSQAPQARMGTDHGMPQPSPLPKRESSGKEESGPKTTGEWGTGSEAQQENNSSWFSYFSCCSLNCHCCGRSRCSNANTNEKLDT